MLRNLPRACRRARPELVEGGLILRCGHCLHRRPSIPQLQQTRNQGVVVVLGPLTLRPCRLNDMQNSAQPIHQLQQPADQLRTHGQPVIAQRTQQALARMRQPLQPAKSQKARRPLDGMDCAEDLRHQFFIVRLFLKLGEAKLHPLETFLALRDKLLG